MPSSVPFGSRLLGVAPRGRPARRRLFPPFLQDTPGTRVGIALHDGRRFLPLDSPLWAERFCAHMSVYRAPQKHTSTHRASWRDPRGVPGAWPQGDRGLIPLTLGDALGAAVAQGTVWRWHLPLRTRMQTFRRGVGLPGPRWGRGGADLGNGVKANYVQKWDSEQGGGGSPRGCGNLTFTTGTEEGGCFLFG